MSTVVYIGDEVPEQKLRKIKRFKAYLSKEQQEEIIKQIQNTFDNIDISKYIISMTVDVQLKEYKDIDKKSFYYDNDTKNT